MKNFFQRHQYLLEVIIILLVGLIPLLWYKQNSLGLGHDMGFPLAPIDYFKDRLFSWTDRVGAFGSNQTESFAGVFIHGLEALIASLGFSLVHTQQIVFIFWFTLPGIAMYIFLRSLHPEKENFNIRLSGSLFYMMNHYLLQGWMIAERTKFSIVAAMPLVILAIINVVYKEKSVLKNAIFLSIVLFFLNGGAGIPLWGGLAVATFTTLIVMFVFSSQPFVAKAKRTLGFLVLSAIFISLLNLYWAYPYLASFSQNFTTRADASGGGEGAVNWSIEISKYASFTNIFRMQGIPDWYNNPEHPYSNNFLNNYFLVFLSIVFPLIGFIGLIKKQDEHPLQTVLKINFLLILLLGIPLTAGSHFPTGALYDFVLVHVPGFLIFRTPFLKFGMLIWFAYAYLIAIGLKNITAFIYPKIPISFFKSSLGNTRIVVLIIFAVLLGVYNYPFFTGSFFDWSLKYSTRVKVPDYIFGAKKEIDSNKFTTRTLILPYLNDQVKTDSYTWKYYSLSHLLSILSRRATVLNDVTLTGPESMLVNGIYNQLEKTGKSNLLSYAGIDHALIRDDFSSPESSSYSTSKINSATTSSQQFALAKKIGEWSYLDVVQGETRPLIYAPRNISDLMVDPLHLSIALSYPEIPTLADAFIFSDKSGKSLSPNKAYQYIIEGECLDCKPKVSKDPLDLKPSRILPGSKIYALVKLIGVLRLHRLKDPSQKIDFVLGTMAKEASAVDILIKDPKSTQTVKDIIKGWDQSLDEVEKNYLSIEDASKKKESSERIYRYLWSFILKGEEWGVVAANAENVYQLLDFEDSAKAYIKKLGLQPPRFEELEQSRFGKYQLSIPRNGMYRLAVYVPLVENFAQGVSGRNVLSDSSIQFNNQHLDITQAKDDNQWFKTKELSLEPGDYSLNISRIPNKKVSYRDLSMKAAPAQSGCQWVNLNQLDLQSRYQISFNYESISGKQLFVKIIEKDLRGAELGQLKIQSRIGEVPGEHPIYKNSYTYKPEKFVRSATLQFCIDGNYNNSTEAKVSGLEIEEIFPEPLIFAYSLDQFNQVPSPKIEFVALNQTKYLIRTNSQPDKFMLIFNSRLDNNWKLREVDPAKSSMYFQGERKEYLGGNVTEYQMQDNHVISDLIFPSQSTNINPSGIHVNGFANAWDINTTQNGFSTEDRKVYLLEYQIQNDAYILAAVSTLSFIILVVLLISIKHEKSN